MQDQFHSWRRAPPVCILTFGREAAVLDGNQWPANRSPFNPASRPSRNEAPAWPPQEMVIKSSVQVSSQSPVSSAGARLQRQATRADSLGSLGHVAVATLNSTGTRSRVAGAARSNTPVTSCPGWLTSCQTSCGRSMEKPWRTDPWP